MNYNTAKTITAEGKDFEILFTPPHNGISFSIHDLQFDKTAKTLTIFLENPGESKVRGDIKIPHDLLNGNMTTIIDDVIRTDFRVKQIPDYSWTTFHINPENHTLQITGTTAIPEFETLASLILVLSLVPVFLWAKN